MKTLLVTLSIFASISLAAQSHLSAYKTDNKQLNANITLQDGYTIYGLSKAMGTNVKEIIAQNPSIDINNMELKTTLSLPINPAAIKNAQVGLSNPVIVTYRVQAKETLFSIARVYAKKDVATIKSLNNKRDNVLSIGDELILGWIDWPYANTDKPLLGNLELQPSDEPIIDTIAEYVSGDIRVVIPSPVELDGVTPLVPVDSLLAEVKEDSIVFSTFRGIALMEKRGSGSEDLLVIHKDAEINSEIQIYNPMMRRRVKAKVVAQIPKNSYPEDVSVVISPAVASALGALDRRFMVEMTYVAAN